MKKISHKKFSFNRQLRHETLEAREMLAVNPLLCNPAVITAGSYADETMQYEPPVITGGELGELTLAAQNEELISFAAPAGYNEHDWNKVEAAKLNNGLLDSHLTWTESGGQMRLTGISANYAGLYGNLDLSGCTALQWLDCHDNPQLQMLNVSGCTALQWLDCYDNPQLQMLNVSGCTALQYLSCTFNQLTSLDVSDCTALQYLSCSYNYLTSLDVTKNTALQTLYCYWNQLTSLDVSKNTALQFLYCSSNQLTSLDVSKN